MTNIASKPALGSWFAALIGLFAACGPSPGAQRRTIEQVRQAITTSVSTPDELEAHDRLVRDLVDSGALEGKNRIELEQALGPPTNCDSSADCQRAGFDYQDVFYLVGQSPRPAGVHVPILFVGFDTQGRVDRTRYLFPAN